MRRTHVLPCAAGLLAALILITAAPRAEARDWYWSHWRKTRPGWGLNIEAGIRGFYRFKRRADVKAAPDLWMIEAKALLWRSETFGLFAFAGFDPGPEGALTGGGGIRFPLITVTSSQGRTVSGLTILLEGGGGVLKVNPPPPGWQYPEVSVYAKGSVVLEWGLGTQGFYLDTDIGFANVHGRLYFAPMVAIAYQF